MAENPIIDEDDDDLIDYCRTKECPTGTQAIDSDGDGTFDECVTSDADPDGNADDPATAASDDS